MVTRQKFPLISIAILLTLAVSIFLIGMIDDFTSGFVFLFKAAYFPIVILSIIVFLFSGFVVKNSIYIYLTILVSALLLLTVSPNVFQSENYRIEAEKHGFSVGTFSAMTRSDNGGDIAQFVKANKPDIFCLQEVKEVDVIETAQLYRYASEKKGGLIIFSRFPLKNLKSGVGNQSVEITLPRETGNEKLLLINVHMPRQYRKDGLFVKAKNDLTDMVNVKQPIILCGDFNVTPKNSMYSYIVKRLGFHDVQKNQVWDYGHTFPNGNRRLAMLGAWIKIDYLFFQNLYSGSSKVISASKLSDHKAILSRFIVQETGK